MRNTYWANQRTRIIVEGEADSAAACLTSKQIKYDIITPTSPVNVKFLHEETYTLPVSKLSMILPQPLL